MKDNTYILKIIIYGVLLSSVAILLNDLRDFNWNRFESFLNWSRTADKNENWFTSQNAIEWSYYAVSAMIFFFRGYLIYGFTYFVSILNEVEEGNYFGDKIISHFKKIGRIFITYAINIVVLKCLLVAIEKSTFNVFQEARNELMLLIPCGLGFYILAEIFKKAKNLKEENDLTV
ncbi:DUF2975 domain-containing protein [Flagellimonas sp. 2504JD1-5]